MKVKNKRNFKKIDKIDAKKDLMESNQ